MRGPIYVTVRRAFVSQVMNSREPVLTKEKSFLVLSRPAPKQSRTSGYWVIAHISPCRNHGKRNDLSFRGKSQAKRTFATLLSNSIGLSRPGARFKLNPCRTAASDLYARWCRRKEPLARLFLESAAFSPNRHSIATPNTDSRLGPSTLYVVKR